MCIVLVTTAHPRYALIVIDNRDEFVLRPTSRPYWWKATATPAVSSSKTGSETSGGASATSSSASSERASPGPSDLAQAPGRDYNVGRCPAPAPPASTTSPDQPAHNPKEVMVLSARDLERAERGTWLGISKGGNFAVLTNYRETDTRDSAHPVHCARSRGGMVTAWLCADPSETLEEFCHRMLVEEGVQSVGGFSLMCGKLRKRASQNTGCVAPKSAGVGEIEPLAIISNRYQYVDQIPRIAGRRGETVGLSNACYGDPEKWPKIDDGREILAETIADAISKKWSEDELVKRLFNILDRDTMPDTQEMSFEDAIMQLKKSIFIPPIGDEQHKKEMEEEQAKGKGMEEGHEFHLPLEGHLEDKTMGFMTGMYGTQRQTVLLVGWDGRVRFVERALWDAHGNPVPRGQGDMTFEFTIDGWEDGAAESATSRREGQLRSSLS